MSAEVINFSILFTFSKVLDPWNLDNDFFADPENEVPLHPRHKEVIADNLDWHDFLWSDFALHIKKDSEVIAKYEPLHNFKLYDIKRQ